VSKFAGCRFALKSAAAAACQGAQAAAAIGGSGGGGGDCAMRNSKKLTGSKSCKKLLKTAKKRGLVAKNRTEYWLLFVLQLFFRLWLACGQWAFRRI